MPARTPEDKRARGRPRSPGVDARISEAVLGILAARGYASLTVDAVATAASVTRATIYRRWPNKAAMVAAVLGEAVPTVAVDLTGDALRDLQALAVEYVLALSRSGFADTVFAIRAEAQHDPTLAEALTGDCFSRRSAAVEQLVELAVQAGQMSADVPAEMVRDLLLGPLMYRWLAGHRPLDRDEAWSVVEVASRALRV